MTGILVAFTIALLVPLFVATWRTSLLGLSVQGALMASIELRHDAHLSIDTAAAVVDLVVVRALATPAALYLVLRAQKLPPRNDVIAPNLFSWGVALALVVVAFRSADVLVATDGDEQMLVAVAASAFVLGLFVLATSTGALSQIVGLLRVENAIALYEVGGTSRHEPLGIRLGKTALLLGAIGFYRWYLVHLAREESAAAITETAVL